MLSSWKKIFSLEDHRASELKNKAALLKMQFYDNDEFGLKDLLSQFEIFEHRNGEINNILSSGEMDSRNYFFDYQYVVSNGKSSRRIKQSALFFNCKNLSLPQFLLRPEQFYDKLLSWLGFEDINFEAHKEFSDKYKLTGEYKDVIKYYFHKDILDLLSSHTLIHMEGMNYYLVFYSKSQLIPTKMLPSFIHLGNLVYELFKQRSKSRELEFKI